MTQRLVDGEPASFDGETIVIGALDSYERAARRYRPGATGRGSGVRSRLAGRGASREVERQLPLDADARPQRLEPAAAQRLQQLPAELERLVEAPDDLAAELAHLREHGGLVDGDDVAAADLPLPPTRTESTASVVEPNAS